MRCLVLVVVALLCYVGASDGVSLIDQLLKLSKGQLGESQKALTLKEILATVHGKDNAQKDFVQDLMNSINHLIDTVPPKKSKRDWVADLMANIQHIVDTVPPKRNAEEWISDLMENIQNIVDTANPKKSAKDVSSRAARREISTKKELKSFVDDMMNYIDGLIENVPPKKSKRDWVDDIMQTIHDIIANAPPKMAMKDFLGDLQNLLNDLWEQHSQNIPKSRDLVGDIGNLFNELWEQYSQHIPKAKDFFTDLQSTFNQLLEMYSPIPKSKAAFKAAMGDVKVGIDALVKNQSLTVAQLAKLLVARETIQKEGKALFGGQKSAVSERDWMQSAMDGLLSGIDAIIDTVSGGSDTRRTLQKNLPKLNNMKKSVQVLEKYMGAKDWFQDIWDSITALVDRATSPKTNTVAKKGFLKEFTALFAESLKAAKNFQTGGSARNDNTAEKLTYRLVKSKVHLQKLRKTRDGEGALDSFIQGFMGGIDTIVDLFGGSGGMQREKLINLRNSFEVLKKTYAGKNADVKSIEDLMAQIQDLIDSAVAEG